MGAEEACLEEANDPREKTVGDLNLGRINLYSPYIYPRAAVLTGTGWGWASPRDRDISDFHNWRGMMLLASSG